MTLANWADVTTIAASILVVLGIGWLVFVQIRRHRRFQEDYEFLCEHMKNSVDAHNEAVDQSINEIRQLAGAPETERIAALITVIMRQLGEISSELQTLQLIALADYFRQQDSDEEVTSLLANWKLRSPITRRE